MAFAASGAANHSELPSPQHQQELHGKQLSWEQKCFLAHHVNFCKDFEALLESFNMHFDTDCDLDSLDHFLRKNCKDDEFLMYYQNADKYKWYFDDPLKTAHPIILLASRAMRTELRSFLAYHHSHGMSLPVLKENFNSTFPAEARESKEIATQLNFFGTNNQLRHSLSTFASRYSWHPEFNDTIQACNQAGNKAASRSAARDRLRRDKKTAETFANNEAALALQQQLLGQSEQSGEGSSAAQAEPMGPSKSQNSESEEGSSAAETQPVGPSFSPSEEPGDGSSAAETQPVGPSFSPQVVSEEQSLAEQLHYVGKYLGFPFGYVDLHPTAFYDPKTGAITGRHRHAAGRARSASPATRGAGAFTRDRRGSL